MDLQVSEMWSDWQENWAVSNVAQEWQEGCQYTDTCE